MIEKVALRKLGWKRIVNVGNNLEELNKKKKEIRQEKEAWVIDEMKFYSRLDNKRLHDLGWTEEDQRAEDKNAIADQEQAKEKKESEKRKRQEPEKVKSPQLTKKQKKQKKEEKKEEKQETEREKTEETEAGKEAEEEERKKEGVKLGNQLIALGVEEEGVKLGIQLIDLGVEEKDLPIDDKGEFDLPEMREMLEKKLDESKVVQEPIMPDYSDMRSLQLYLELKKFGVSDYEIPAFNCKDERAELCIEKWKQKNDKVDGNGAGAGVVDSPVSPPPYGNTIVSMIDWLEEKGVKHHKKGSKGATKPYFFENASKRCRRRRRRRLNHQSRLFWEIL